MTQALGERHAYLANNCSMKEKKRKRKHKKKKRKEKATPVCDHNGSLCMETVAAQGFVL